MKVYQWFNWTSNPQFWEKSQPVSGTTKQSCPPCKISLGGLDNHSLNLSLLTLDIQETVILQILQPVWLYIFCLCCLLILLVLKWCILWYERLWFVPSPCFIYTLVKHANAVRSIKQSPVLKGHLFLVLS